MRSRFSRSLGTRVPEAFVVLGAGVESELAIPKQLAKNYHDLNDGVETRFRSTGEHGDTRPMNTGCCLFGHQIASAYTEKETEPVA